MLPGHQPKGVFYAEPANTHEQASNDRQLEAPHAEQLAMIGALFDRNAQVHQDLYRALLEKRLLGRDQLRPFLDRVRLPEGFPIPFKDVEDYLGST